MQYDVNLELMRDVGKMWKDEGKRGAKRRGVEDEWKMDGSWMEMNEVEERRAMSPSTRCCRVKAERRPNWDV